MTFDRRNNRVQIANCKLQIEKVSGCNLTPDRRFAVANTRSKIRRGEHPTPPRGMTLIELLVVIVILTTVVAAAIPIMAPSNVDRQLREASRTANTFITGAQARAIASGRPYGIALKRLSAETKNAEDRGVCLEVFYVEQQAPFTGYDRNSRVCVSLLRNVGLATIRFVTRGPTQGDPLPTGWDADLFPTNMLRPGDVIEVGGSRFELLDHTQLARKNPDLIRDIQLIIGTARVDIDPPITGYFKQRPNTVVQIIARPINDTGQHVEPDYDNQGFQLGEDRPLRPAAPARPQSPYWARPTPYKILRQATITSDEPYQLPEGTAIDLRASGVGNTFFYYPTITSTTVGAHPRVDNDAPIFIMFTPEGRVSRVTFNWSTVPSTGAPQTDKFDQAVVDHLFLLVGRRENSPPVASATDPTLNAAFNSPTTTDEQRAELREPINWLNGDSRWLVLGAQTGRVVTIENGFVEMSAGMLQDPQFENRRNQQILAAREFTREMSQLGGR
jgi:prepilin-type N-terminal cleavage/methylation domain-containing protein